jgi:hypothetical protein
MPDARAINFGSPVNWGHYLNRGLQAWWKVLPGTTGGGVLRDITNHKNDGVLTSMTNLATNGFRGQSHPGGFGSLLFDGTTGYATGPNTDIPTGSADRSFSGWIRVLNNATYCTLINTGTNVSFGRCLFWVMKTSPYFGTAGCPTLECTGFTHQSTIPINDGKWHHIGVSLANASTTTPLIIFYVDGVPTGSTSNSTFHALNTTAGGSFWLGGNVAESLYGNSQADDVKAWNRAISAAEFLADYQLSLQGDPGRLNRIGYPYFKSGGGLLLKRRRSILALQAA